MSTLGIKFVAATGEIRHGGKVCHVRPMHIDILEHLLDEHPRPIPSDELLYLLYGDNEVKIKKLHRRLWAHLTLMRRLIQRAGMPLDIVAHRDGDDHYTAYAIELSDTA